MNTVKGEIASLATLKDLKPLLSTNGPCLSVYLPLSNARSKQNELTWKECIQNLRSRAEKFGAGGRELVDSVADWSAIAPDANVKGHSLAVFRSADVFQVVSLDSQVAERAEIGPHFYIRPLLPELTQGTAFYLLALSQKNTRLLHCTWSASEEVPLTTGTKNDFEDWMNLAKPDHTLVNNGAVGSSGPAMTGALAPKGTAKETKSDDLLHFFKQIDHGVSEVLKGKTEPLILCGVDYELPQYKTVNSYPHLASEAVHGAPNGFKAGEMHARALEAMQRSYENKVDEALVEWNHKAASSGLKDVITAAHDGRVLTLLVSDSQEKVGSFDEETHSVKGKETGSAGDEDLVNDAAVQTILHAGKVLVAPHSKMPNGAPVAAIYRF